MEQMSRVERKKQAARTRILDAAEELFLREDGYNKTAIREIAELADVSIGSVYMHFVSKPDIMAELLEKIIDDYISDFSFSISERKSGIRQLEDYISHFFLLAAHPKFLAYLHNIERLDPSEISPEAEVSLKERGKKFYSLLKGAIAGGQADGSIKKLESPDLVSYVILHIIRSFVRDITGNSLTEPLRHFPQFTGEMAMGFVKKMIILSLEEKLSGGDD
jgi:AcrR family transcriptional regulator